MRILVVATQVRLPDTHGGSTHVGELVASLRRHGPVMALCRRGSTAEGAVGVSWKTGYPPLLRRLYPLLYLPASLRAARRFRPDVIYERASSYGLGAMLSRALDVPMLCMVLDEHLTATSLRRAERIVATDLEVVPDAYRPKAVKVSWGANAERFDRDIDGGPARERYGLKDPTVCYVGSFKHWHGLGHLVAAAADLGERVGSFLMVGDGPCRPEIEARVQVAGLGRRFTFTGAVPYEDVPELVAAARICVAPFEPSLHPRSGDGFVLDPLKLFEYLAMAKPTVTVSSANIERLFDDGVHLRTVAPADKDALSGALAELLDDPEAAREMGERGRERVLERHTWAAHADQLAGLFNEMLERGASQEHRP